MKKSLPRLYVILDADYVNPARIPPLAGQLSSTAEVKMFQVRWKNAPSDKEFFELVKRVIKSVSRDSIIIVNDRTDIALASNAHGVHVGENDLPPGALRKIVGSEFLIGYSAHSLRELTQKEIVENSSYLAFGTIFPTSTKKTGTVVQGIEKLKKAVSKSPLPLYAIGGINLNNIQEVINTGVHGIACISAILGAENPVDAALKFLTVLGEVS